MDWTQFLKQFLGLNDAIAGVPLVGVVLALVQWIKNTFSLDGQKVELVSMGIGIVLGVAYRVSVGIEPTVAWWLGTAVYGILLGLVPSQLYKTGTQVVTKAVQKSVDPLYGQVPTEVSHTPPEIIEKYNRP